LTGPTSVQPGKRHLGQAVPLSGSHALYAPDGVISAQAARKAMRHFGPQRSERRATAHLAKPRPLLVRTMARSPRLFEVNCDRLEANGTIASEPARTSESVVNPERPTPQRSRGNLPGVAEGRRTRATVAVRRDVRDAAFTHASASRSTTVLPPARHCRERQPSARCRRSASPSSRTGHAS